MKRLARLSSLLLSGIVLFCASASFADSNLDPKIIISDPSPCDTGCTSILSNNFSFGIGGNTTLTFQNNSGNDWGELLLTWIPGEPVDLITVVFGAGFEDWRSFSLDAGDLSNPNLVGLDLICIKQPTCDIHSGSTVFNFDFAPSAGDWQATHFNAQALSTVPVPEPGSMMYLFSTIAVLATRKKLWKSLRPNFSLNTR